MEQCQMESGKNKEETRPYYQEMQYNRVSSGSGYYAIPVIHTEWKVMRKICINMNDLERYKIC